MDFQCWVGFNLVKGIGSVRLQTLINHFGNVETAWRARPQELLATGLSPKLVDGIIRVRTEGTLDATLAQIEKLGIQVITWDDDIFPRRLKEIDQPPPVLYALGSLTQEDDWAVAIVGTRRMTSYGRQVTEEVARTLAQNGVTVVSGLARGVDAVAHRSAIDAGGRSLAVLGSGVDVIYPAEHRRLSQDLIESGAILSDYPPGTPPEAVNFPPRNRIISGLTLAVVVIEASERSGALITASFAADQGRDVFAVPGNIHAAQSKGTNRLIQKGAQPLLSPEEVLLALDLTLVTDRQAARKTLPSNPVEEKLLNLLSQEPRHVDELRLSANLPIAEVTATLTILELKGMVRQVGGMHYVAVREGQFGYFVGDEDSAAT